MSGAREHRAGATSRPTSELLSPRQQPRRQQHIQILPPPRRFPQARTPPGASLSGFSHALGALPATARLSANLTGEQSNALHNLWSEYEIAFRRAGALDVVAPLGARKEMILCHRPAADYPCPKPGTIR